MAHIKNVKGQSLALAVIVMVMILNDCSVTVDADSHHQHHQSHPVPQMPVSAPIFRERKIGDDFPNLSESYYAFTCPLLTVRVANLVKTLIQNDNTLPAAWLRVQFHDCFVHGCDASVLINGSDPNTEVNAFPNKGSLRGLDVFETIKTSVEQLCPGVVSCADLLALVARDAIYYSSGAYWHVPFGRKDGLVSSAADANAALPSPFFTYPQLVQSFAAVGLTAKDMVVLSGAHTIGFTHCIIVQSRLYGFPGSPNGVDPTLNSHYATKLQSECSSSAAAGGIILPLDPTQGNQTFDSQYYLNVVNNKGLLPSDAALLTDPLGLDIVQNLVGNIFNPNNPFFFDFGLAMEKMGRINVLTGDQGQIRQHCNAFN